jgi:polygalacturonase
MRHDRLHPPPTSRRAFLRFSAGVALLRPLGAAHDPWDQAPAILSRIRPPDFPQRQFDIVKFGARAGGVSDSSEAIARAIAECNRAGGGRVIVPPGDFLTGAIHLRSNVNLHVSAGAILRFSRDPRRYLPVVFTRWEGVECMNYSPLIYAYGQRNIAVTGPGVLDGQADAVHWWDWKSSQAKARAALVEMGENDVAVEKRVFGEGSYLRPNFLQLYRCRNVLIEDVTLHNSPMWQIHPVLSENITVRRVKPTSLGPNNDGCNPESCRDVLIEDCLFDTGDDCIAIKSGRNRDGRRVAVPSRDIIIRGCQMKDGHGGVTIGSEASGGVRNVFAENCRMDSPNLDRVLRIKTNSVRGGVIEHVFMRNVTVGQVADAILHIDLYYEEGDRGKYPPLVRDIELRDVSSLRSAYALYLRGYPSSPIRDVRLLHCRFEGVEKSDVLENVRGLAHSPLGVSAQ